MTDRERQIVAAIEAAIVETGESPSVREIGARVGLRSTSSVVYHLRHLEERGMIRHQRYRHRTYRTTS